MSGTPVILADEQWEQVLDALEERDDEAAADCRDAISTQVAESTDSLDADTAFELLSDPVRREVLWACQERDCVDVDELADSVAGEIDSDPEYVSADLHHSHIPKLSAAGVLRVDSGSVTYAGDRLLDSLVAVDRE